MLHRRILELPGTALYVPMQRPNLIKELFGKSMTKPSGIPEFFGALELRSSFAHPV